MKRAFGIQVFLAVFILLTSACRFVPYFAPDGALIKIYSDLSRIETGGGKAGITILGFTSEGAPLRDHTTVLLSASSGQIAPQAELIRGKAEVEFVSGAKAGPATIVAVSGTVRSNELVIQVGPGELSFLTLKADPASLQIRGGRSEITVGAFDADNRPLPGIPLQLTTSKGYFENAANPLHTDSAGICRNWLVTGETALVSVKSGSLSREITVFVQSNSAPTARFFFSPKTPRGDDDIIFNASESHDSDGYIVSYDWFFGDGARSSGKITGHNYRWSGSTDKVFTVVLQVTDNHGASASATQDLTVKVNTAPTPRFFFTPKNPKGKEDILFDASESFDPDGHIVSYKWHFGDGAEGSGRSVTHNYNWSGSGNRTYTVILQVTDNSGAVASLSQDITVSPEG